MEAHNTETCQEELERLRQEMADLRDVEARLRREIVERGRAEDSLRASESRFRTLVEQSPFSIILYDKDGRTLMANPASKKLWRLSSEEFSFLMANYNILEDETLAQTEIFKGIKRAFAGESVVIPPSIYNFQDHPVPKAAPENMWVAAYVYPIKDEVGQVQEVVIMHEDVTDRLQAEVDLRQSEALHRTLVQAIPYGVQEVDVDGRITYINPAFCRTTGYTKEELTGRAIWELLPDETEQRQLQEMLQYLHEFHPKPGSYYVAAQTKDGRVIQTQTDWDYRRAADGTITGTIAIVTDITARKRAEERLENYTQRLQIVHEVAQAILSAQSPEDIAYVALVRIRETLPFARSSLVLFDFEAEEGFILASFDRRETGIRAGSTRPLTDFDMDERLFFGQHVMRDRLDDALPALVERLKAEGIHSYLSFPLLAQEKLFGALYLASDKLDTYGDHYVETLREIAQLLAVAIQQARLHEQVQLHADGLERRVVERTRDLTEANERLLELDRLKTKFISDVTHELRTPVTNLGMYLDLMTFGKPEKFERYQTVLREQTERLKTLVEDSLDLSRLDVRRNEIELTPQPPAPIVEQAAAAYRRRAQGKGLAFDVTVATDLPDVLANPDQLGRAIGNLLQNAIQYTASGSVQVRAVWDETAVSVAIQVQDTGMGMDEDDLVHCFEPFYRGVQVGQSNMPGNGLGLALVKEIVEMHNGRVIVKSAVDEGSHFTIWLPVATEKE